MITPIRKPLAPEMSEAEAIEGVKQGKSECFRFLYDLHNRRIYSVCLRMVGNVDVAEDLTQEAFLQMYLKIAGFRGEAAFSTWLHRITVNIVLMKLRKKGLLEVSLTEALEPSDEDGTQKDYGSEDQTLVGSVDRVILKRAIERLSPVHRIIFVLHDIEGYEHHEIAKMVGCSNGNSKSQLHKARTKLRTLMIARAAKHIAVPLQIGKTLAERLRWYARGYTKRSGVEVLLELSPNLGRLPDDHERAYFHIVRKRLVNMRKHSVATVAKVCLTQDEHGTRLEISDNECGLPGPAPATSDIIARLDVSLAEMRVHVRRLGGRLEIRSTGNGSVVSAVLPFPGEQGNEPQPPAVKHAA